MLEVIGKGSVTKTHPVPLLFVHGAWHAAWCWDEYFLDYFAAHGFRAAALSLRGHGNSTLSTPLNSVTFADYLDDVRTAVEMIGCEPVLVGHSLGGLLVQKYLENRRAPAAVLLASYPPQWTRRMAVAFRATVKHPSRTIRANTVGTLADLVNTPPLAREALFSENTPQATVESCAARMEPESKRASAIFVRARPSLVTTPLLILDGERDAVLAREVEATARAYHTRAEIFPDMGHDMMLEPGWAAVAELIDLWLTGQGL